MLTYGIESNGEYIVISNSLLGAKQYATRHGYTEVYKAYNNYHISLVSTKLNKREWSF